MKRILDWFDTLPEEVRMRAFCDTDRKSLFKKVNSLHAAVVHISFEVHPGYWLEIFRNAKAGYYKN